MMKERVLLSLTLQVTFFASLIRTFGKIRQILVDSNCNFAAAIIGLHRIYQL